MTRLPTGGKETSGPAQACHNSELILFLSPVIQNKQKYFDFRRVVLLQIEHRKAYLSSFYFSIWT